MLPMLSDFTKRDNGEVSGGGFCCPPTNLTSPLHTEKLMNRNLLCGAAAFLVFVGLSLLGADLSLAGHCGHHGSHGCHGCHGGGYGCHGGYNNHYGCHGSRGCHGGHYQEGGAYEEMPHNLDSSPSGDAPSPASSRNGYQRRPFGFRNVSFQR